MSMENLKILLISLTNNQQTNSTNELFNRRKLSLQIDSNRNDGRIEPENNHRPNTGDGDTLEIVDFVESDFDDDEDDKDKGSIGLRLSKTKMFANNGSKSNGNQQPKKTKFGKVFRLIDIKTAKKLKCLLIGTSTSKISHKWCKQYFDFETKIPELWYGLIQYEGGPCGVLAVVQAYLCAQIFHDWTATRQGSQQQQQQKDEQQPLSKEMDYFDRTSSEDKGQKDTVLRQSLCEAIGDILWQIVSATAGGSGGGGGNSSNVVLAFEQNQALLESTAAFNSDGITERIALVEFDNRQELIQFLLELFAENWHSLGCVSLVYSCILTRGFERIEKDNDFGASESLLTTECLLCTQELVNLMLTGRAVSNVFDRNLNCSDLILQGITRQSTIGFLSLHEYYKNFTVGSCYKNPKLPIYVVLSEGHFSVLFSKKKSQNLKSGNRNRFDLYYYDGFLRLEHEICLTIDLQDQSPPLEHPKTPIVEESQQHSSTNVPIECVIKTKWPTATIDWNGTEKIF